MRISNKKYKYEKIIYGFFSDNGFLLFILSVPDIPTFHSNYCLINNIQIEERTLVSVSYTHLDVYKRQV